ncbi:hypothetical protein Sya03_49070 [Spirilliplanes yamanashiensis]|uniref:Peptidase S1 domain-containing protein n=2 Tax=Spirilliplanes yamanashiensis TaxID=42233 RepID=A0A8J3YCP6_9ACTN|nr:hypothetical protein Sya03_49070 [Spirilliplanes yamanashiensis]
MLSAAAGAAATLLLGGAALAVAQGRPATDADGLRYLTRVDIGAGRAACTGVLLSPWWVATAKSCFGAGAPAAGSAVTVDGRRFTVDRLTPHPDRDLTLARLDRPALGVPVATVATTPPAPGDELTVAGYGRTADTWVPTGAHTATFQVGAVAAGTLDIAPADGAGALCRGDAGGPALRGTQVVALHSTSWQGGCLGTPATETRRGTVGTRLDDLGPWLRQHAAAPAVQQLTLTGTRVGVLTGGFDAVVKEGGLSTAWVREHVNVTQVALSGDRIGVLLADGTALVKQGGLSAAWVTVHTGMRQLVLAGDRIGVVDADGNAWVKDGGLSAAWVRVHTGVDQLALDGDRVGVLRDGTALVKQGGLSAAWVTVHTGMRRLVLAGDRIGVVDADGNAWVKDGGLSAAWVKVHTGVDQLALAGDRVGVLLHNRSALVKQGGLSAAWVTVLPGRARSLTLAGDRVDVVDVDDVAWVKQGGLSTAWVRMYG